MFSSECTSRATAGASSAGSRRPRFEASFQFRDSGARVDTRSWSAWKSTLACYPRRYRRSRAMAFSAVHADVLANRVASEMLSDECLVDDRDQRVVGGIRVAEISTAE